MNSPPETPRNIMVFYPPAGGQPTTVPQPQPPRSNMYYIVIIVLIIIIALVIVLFYERGSAERRFNKLLSQKADLVISYSNGEIKKDAYDKAEEELDSQIEAAAEALDDKTITAAIYRFAEILGVGIAAGLTLYLSDIKGIIKTYLNWKRRGGGGEGPKYPPGGETVPQPQPQSEPQPQPEPVTPVKTLPILPIIPPLPIPAPLPIPLPV